MVLVVLLVVLVFGGAYKGLMLTRTSGELELARDLMQGAVLFTFRKNKTLQICVKAEIMLLR